MAKKPEKVYGAQLTEQGHEILDPTPISIPLKFKRGETLTESVRRILREEGSRAAQLQGYETFEEANDFEVGDDWDPQSEYEDYDMEFIEDDRTVGTDGVKRGTEEAEAEGRKKAPAKRSRKVAKAVQPARDEAEADPEGPESDE